MSLCGPCREKWLAWLDYRLPPAQPVLVAIGRQDAAHIGEVRKRRFEEWRETIRWHQAHIRELCAAGKHADPGPGGPSSASSSRYVSAPPL